MGRRLIFATLSIGLMMSCTLVTAHASEYRKQTKELTLDNSTVVSSHTYAFTKHDFATAIVADNHYDFMDKATYLFPVNEPKPKNRKVNGLINDRREQERTCIGLNL